jgi:hypothetical protein
LILKEHSRKTKKPGYLFSRQPGYLLKTRDFPFQFYGWFGFILISLIVWEEVAPCQWNSVAPVVHEGSAHWNYY